MSNFMSAFTGYGSPGLSMSGMDQQANYAMGIDPSSGSPGMFSGQQPTMDWTKNALQGAVPSFMQPGFFPGTPAGGGGGVLDSLGGFDGISKGLGAIGGIANLFMGMKQYGLAKDQLAFQKDSFNRNFEASRTTTNASLEDRQRARVASNPGAYQSVGDYMSQNGVK